MNKRIKIMKFKGIPDGAGGYFDDWKIEEGWEEVATVWAAIEPLRGREFFQAQQAQAEVTHKVTIRYRKDVDKSQIIKYADRRLDIDYIINIDEENKYLEIFCTERI
ncbi:phage head closure protein [Alkalithermobacter thermoalcaliphilus]